MRLTGEFEATVQTVLEGLSPILRRTGRRWTLRRPAEGPENRPS
jgi:hypothetical protein